MPPMALWKEPIRIWYNTQRLVGAAVAGPQGARFAFGSKAYTVFETAVRPPDDTSDISQPLSNEHARALRELQYPLQLLTSLLCTTIKAPFGTSKQFKTGLKFEKPQSEEEANVLFCDAGVVPGGDADILRPNRLRPGAVQSRLNRGEQIKEELISTPYCIISLFTTLGEIVGAAVILTYSSRVFVRECEIINLVRSGKSFDDKVCQLFGEPQKTVVEPRHFPQSLIDRQPEDRDFWILAERTGATPPLVVADARSIRENPASVALLTPFWIEEVRHLRELSYILAALLVVVLSPNHCRHFSRRLDRVVLDDQTPRPDSDVARHWLGHIAGGYDLGTEIHNAMLLLKSVYRSQPDWVEYEDLDWGPSLFLNTQRDWRYPQFSRYFYLWHLFETTSSVPDIVAREMRLIEELHERKYSNSPLIAALNCDAHESGFTLSEQG
jgi:hypothetical protein